jgi:hypothetical protein
MFIGNPGFGNPFFAKIRVTLSIPGTQWDCVLRLWMMAATSTGGDNQALNECGGGGDLGPGTFTTLVGSSISDVFVPDNGVCFSNSSSGCSSSYSTTLDQAVNPAAQEVINQINQNNPAGFINFTGVTLGSAFAARETFATSVVLAGEAAVAMTSTTTLYRAVDSGELQSIGENGGMYTTQQGMTEANTSIRQQSRRRTLRRICQVALTR